MAFDNQTTDNQTTDNQTTDNQTTDNQTTDNQIAGNHTTESGVAATTACNTTSLEKARNDNWYGSRGRNTRQSDMYTIARSILHGTFAPETINDAVDVIRGYHGAGLRDENGSIKFEVSDAVRAVLGGGCSTAMARLIVATLYPKAYETVAD